MFNRYIRGTITGLVLMYLLVWAGVSLNILGPIVAGLIVLWWGFAIGVRIREYRIDREIRRRNRSGYLRQGPH